MAGEEIVIALILVVALTMMIAVGVVARRYKKAGPDEALVIYGRKGPAGANYKVLPPGSGRFIPPIVQAHKVLDVGAKTLYLQVSDALTRSGVPLTIELVAMYRVSHEPEMLHRAATMLLSRARQDIEDLVQPVIAGATRAVAVQLEVEQINSDRDAFAKRVKGMCEQEFAKMGLELFSLITKDVVDQVGYLEALGKRRTAEVKRDAIIAEATARRDALAGAAERQKEAQRIQLETDVHIAALQKERDKAIAGFAAEVDDHKRKVAGGKL